MSAVGVLASGRGSNLQALIEACDEPGHPGRIAVVISDRPKALALERARQAGIPTEVVLKRDHPVREDHDREVARLLAAHGVQWVALAGYMRLITSALLDRFPNRVLNIHPALLPAFGGKGMLGCGGPSVGLRGAGDGLHSALGRCGYRHRPSCRTGAGRGGLVGLGRGSEGSGPGHGTRALPTLRALGSGGAARGHWTEGDR